MLHKKIVIIGPGHPLRGGIAIFNQRLCRQFTDEGHECSIYSFSLQYPSFMFPGTTQYSSEPAPEGIEIYSVINSIHPLNWLQVGNAIRRIKPDIVLVRYWLPLIGPALGTILRRIKKNGHTRIIALTDNVIPHEKRPGDIPFTRYFLKACDAFTGRSGRRCCARRNPRICRRRAAAGWRPRRRRAAPWRGEAFDAAHGRRRN